MRRSPLQLVLPAAVLMTAATSVSAADQAGSSAEAGPPVLEFPRHPALSPDGSWLAFSHQGDIWVAWLDDGAAQRLTAHDAYESHPKWSPDGKWLAFLSNRHGNADVFLMPAAGGAPVRVTWHSENEYLHGWIDNDRLLVGATRDRRYSRRGRGAWVAYRDGRTPEVLADAGMLRPALSPSGRWLCYERGHGDPRRRAYRGAASSALWLFDTQSGTHAELTAFDGNDLDPMWSGDESTIFFLSDRACPGNEDGRELGLWKVSRNGGAPSLVHHPGDESLRYAEISRDGSRIVAELGLGLVVVDTATGSARRIQVTGSFDPSDPEQYEERVNSGASQISLSPDGESIAFVASGDVFVMRKHDKIHRAARVTTAIELDDNPVWVDKGKALLFVSERDGNGEIYRVRPADDDTPFYKSKRFVEERLTQTPEDEYNLDVSPNGKLLAWIRGQGRLIVGDPDTLEERTVITDGFDSPSYSWSPDSAWIAYSKVDDDYNSEVYLARALREGVEEGTPGLEPYNLTRHPDDDVNPVWSPDGRKLAFTSTRRMNDETDVWVAWLRKGDPEMNELERLEAEEAAEKAKKEAEKEKKKKEKGKKEDEPGNEEAEEGAAAGEEQEPGAEQEGQEEAEEEEEEEVDPVLIDFDDLHLRLERVTRREGNESVLGFDHDSKLVYFNASVGTRLTNNTEGETGFYSIELHDRDEEEQLESDPVGSFTRHEKEIFYVKGGKVYGRASKAENYPFDLRFRRDRRELRRAVTEQAWRVLDRGFYDPEFHGHDWAASLAKWRPISSSASTREDFGEAMNWMLGEMNASHMGYFGGGSSAAAEVDRQSTAVLGVLWDESFAGPGRRVAEVIKGMPAHRDHSRLEVGDVVLAVDGEAYESGDNWARLMLGRAERETVLTVRGADGEEREVVIRPARYSQLGGALYRHAADHARERVEEGSGGRLGYIHIQGMGTPSLLEFERDLFNAGEGKDGLLIDVRENGGGWTTDMVLAMLMVKDHAITIPRNGGQGYPQGRRVFATWDKPVVVLCNENSYSNAEIFSWSIRTLGRGPLVGKQTYGAVISTGGAGLLDGSFVRLPLRGWYVNDETMTNMELNGCPPDHPVENLPGDYAQGLDRQLEKAIEVGMELIQ